MMTRICCSTLCILICLQSSAQEQLGLKLGNYAGVHSFQVNPSWQVHGALKWDVNIISAGVFAEQDYFYGAKGSVLRLLNRGAEWMTDRPPGSADGASGSNAVPFYFQERSRYDLNALAVGMAPSFMASVNGHTFGLYFTGRTFASGQQLDGDLGFYNLTDTLSRIGRFDPFQAGLMTWSEIGIAYARNLRQDRWSSMHAGGTLKFLLGYDAASIRNRTATDVFRADGEAVLGPADIDIAWASGYSDDNGYSFDRNGFGVATDIGFTWTGNSNDGKRPYRWKVGVSLLDLGRVWYRKNASDYSYTSPDSSYFSGGDFNGISGPDGFIDAINQSGNAAQAELVDEQIAMWTPLAASVQFDAPIRGPFFISGAAVIAMRFPVGANAVERGDLLAVVPRVELRWVEIGMPVSLYEWTELSLGTYLRLGPLTIGTENLNSWFIPGRLEGSDIYMSLKIHSGMFKRSSSTGKGEGCPALF